MRLVTKRFIFKSRRPVTYYATCHPEPFFALIIVMTNERSTSKPQQLKLEQVFSPRMPLKGEVKDVEEIPFRQCFAN